jgi:MoxR-like ATPase
MNQEIQLLTNQAKEYSVILQNLHKEISKIIVGQDAIIEKLIIALLSGGHVLLEGVPGLAKTLLVQTLSDCINSKFVRLQFTPDLLPADITGTKIYDHASTSFTTIKGPIFSNFILADVMATQNPVESEGTYKLPEAQVDRFMFKLLISYPNKNQESEIIQRFTEGVSHKAEEIITIKNLIQIQDFVSKIYVDEKIRNYIAEIIDATRFPEKYDLVLSDQIEYGASPRASIWLTIASKAHALLAGRGYVIPQDVQDVAYDVLRHRILLTYEAESDEITTDKIIEKVLEKIKIP